MSILLSEVLSAYNGKWETVAQFRERLNIADEATENTPWESLTEYEQSVEIFFTPNKFRYIEHIHGPSIEDFGRTLENTEGERIHLFTSLEYDDEHPYALCEENKESYVQEDLSQRSYSLRSLEKDWEYSETTINNRIVLARLRLPSQQNEFFFFFG